MFAILVLMVVAEEATNLMAPGTIPACQSSEGPRRAFLIPEKNFDNRVRRKNLTLPFIENSLGGHILKLDLIRMIIQD